MPGKLFHIVISAILAGFVLTKATPLMAAEPSALKLSTERVVVFKDGYGLVVKNGSATADADGRAFTTDVPDAAILGSFWAVGEGNKLVGMKAQWDEKREVRARETACISVVEILRANIGKKAMLGLADKRTVSGTISEVLDMPARMDPVAAPAGGFYVETDPARTAFAALRRMQEELPRRGGQGDMPDEDSMTIKRELTPHGGQYVVIDEPEAGRTILHLAQILTVGGKDLSTKMTRQEELFTRSKRLSFDFGKDSAGKAVSVKLFYFTAGVRWIPTYRIAGDLKDKADISLQGEILNEVENVENAALDLVVGVPNFRFKDTVSPLSLEGFLHNALAAATPSYAARSNELRTQMMNSNFAQTFDNRAINVGVGGVSNPAMAADLAGSAGEQDLFVYNIREFSLKRGARATIPLWQNSVPVRHVYTMDVKPVRSRTGGEVTDPAQGGSPLKITRNSVWHQLELSNNSTVPWTTGAALTMRQNLPIGQDLLTYTPVGGNALVPLTIAVDIRGTQEEVEIARKPNVFLLDNYTFTWIQKKGTVTLTNFRKEKATMRISVATGGKVESASDDGKIKINDFVAADWQEWGYHHVNNHSDVTWELTLEPGERKSVNYVVGFYVR